MAGKTKPTDVTGRVREQLLEDNAEILESRAAEMSMASVKAQAKLEEVIDATVPDRQTLVIDEPIEIGTQENSVVIRVVQDIENMTLGAGNNYNFKAGQKYSVTKAVAQHLKEKGYLAGVI